MWWPPVDPTVGTCLSLFVSRSLSSCVKGRIFFCFVLFYLFICFFSLMRLQSEIHRVRRCAGGWEEGPAGAGGVSGAAGKTAGAQDKELFWPEWVDTQRRETSRNTFNWTEAERNTSVLFRCFLDTFAALQLFKLFVYEVTLGQRNTFPF